MKTKSRRYVLLIMKFLRAGSFQQKVSEQKCPGKTIRLRHREFSGQKLYTATRTRKSIKSSMIVASRAVNQLFPMDNSRQNSASTVDAGYNLIAYTVSLTGLQTRPVSRWKSEFAMREILPYALPTIRWPRTKILYTWQIEYEPIPKIVVTKRKKRRKNGKMEMKYGSFSGINFSFLSIYFFSVDRSGNRRLFIGHMPTRSVEPEKKNCTHGNMDTNQAQDRGNDKHADHKSTIYFIKK